jgi:GAF domain-containing protein
MSRFDADGAATALATWAPVGAPHGVRTGDRLGLTGRNVHALVFGTGRSARIDDYSSASAPFADAARSTEVRSTVGVPVSVAGRLWGVMGVTSGDEPLPTGTEARLAAFIGAG